MGSPTSGRLNTLSVATRCGRFEADRYGDWHAPRGTILVVHGMNLRGPRDPRLMVLCHALSRQGFEVIAPRLPEVCACRISAHTITSIEALIESVANQGQVAVVSASFSASMCLLASSSPRVRDRVSAICAIGPYSSATRVLRYLVSDIHADDYGRNIVFRNFLHRAVGPIPELEAVLDAAIVDNALRKTAPKSLKLVESLPAKQKSIYLDLQNIQTRRELADAMFASDDDGLLSRLSLERVPEAIAAPVTLLHGRDDRVIPAEESRALAANLREHNKKVKLEITPLVSHGDHDTELSDLGAIYRAERTFAQFFRAVQG